ncbi:MAG TPA: protein kinase [Gemmataceae bacterium]|nr:protein kinase [Gemmataceae bacterium]
MIGTRLGNWVIDRELGSGGMGHVYLAHEDPAPGSPHPPPLSPSEGERGISSFPLTPEAGERGRGEGGGRRAAVKVLAAELALDPGFQQRFQREIDALRQLNHPAIVRFYEAGRQEGRYYYVMEYIEGRNFEDLLREHGRLPWPEVLDLALQVSPALKHAHDRGIIHRDIKPSNLMRTPTGAVKLTDFGIAHVFASTPLTVSGVVVGTAEFLSPEQAAGKPVSKRSDLYSLGVVLYTLLTGRPPFQGNSFLELLHKHRYAQFDPPQKLVPEVPQEFAEVIGELLEKDPAKRPPDGLVLYRRLDSIRRRLEYRAAPTRLLDPNEPATLEYELAVPDKAGVRRPGPATLMSRLMRQELEERTRAGPIGRLLNRAWVLAALLVLTVGVIAWTFWPASPEYLFRRGAELMASDDPDDWDRAWQDYLGPLESRHPNHPYREEVERFRRQRQEYEAQRRAERDAGTSRPAGEGQWFYQQGLRLRQQGDEAAARRVWENLVRSFRDVPAEEVWVRRAEAQLRKAEAAPANDRWASVRAALERARQLRDQGKRAEAEAIWRGLEELYRDDPSAAAIRAQIRQDRQEAKPWPN